MASTIKLKNGSGAPLAGDLVQGEPALDLTNKRLYTEDSGGNVIEVGVNPTSITTGTITASGEITANGGIALGDNDKATFGASDDLQIYHDGTHSYVEDAGAGNLILKGGADVIIRSASNDADMIRANIEDSVQLYFNGLQKLATTSTGIDVTGTVTADGLTVDSSTSSTVATFSYTGGTDAYLGLDGTGTPIYLGNKNGEVVFQTSGSGYADKLKIANNGDIAFYDSTGSSQSFFWDASAESLGIGTTGPSAALQVYTATANNQLYLTSADTGQAQLSFGGTTDPDGGYIRYSDASDWMAFATQTTERMRIDSSGNVGIGTTSPATPLHVKTNTTTNVGFFDYVGAATICGITDIGGSAELRVAGQVVSFTGAGGAGTEHMRIDASGNLLVGTTAVGASNNNGFTAEPYAGGMVINVGHNGSAANGDGYVFFRRNGTALGSITQVSSTGVSYNITSDERLKENIVDTTHTVDINDIKVRQYDWKSNGEHQRYGFIAQELEAVYPEAVFSPEDPEEMKAVDYSKLVPLLVKEIQDLKAEVAALKGA